MLGSSPEKLPAQAALKAELFIGSRPKVLLPSIVLKKHCSQQSLGSLGSR